MTSSEPDPPALPRITAKEAMFDLDLAVNGMGTGSIIGSMDGAEARKLATMLFAEEGEDLPEEMIAFFNHPQEGDSP
jgi:hypothetical protein